MRRQSVSDRITTIESAPAQVAIRFEVHSIVRAEYKAHEQAVAVLCCVDAPNGLSIRYDRACAGSQPVSICVCVDALLNRCVYFWRQLTSDGLSTAH